MYYYTLLLRAGPDGTSTYMVSKCVVSNARKAEAFSVPAPASSSPTQRREERERDGIKGSEMLCLAGAAPIILLQRNLARKTEQNAGSQRVVPTEEIFTRLPTTIRAYWKAFLSPRRTART